MNKLQWLLDGLAATQLVQRDQLDAFVENGEIEYTWDPDDFSLGLEYPANLLVRDYSGNTAILNLAVMQVLRDIDPNRSTHPKFSATIQSPGIWDIVFIIPFRETQAFAEVPEGEHDIAIDGIYLKSIHDKPPAPVELVAINKTNAVDQ